MLYKFLFSVTILGFILNSGGQIFPAKGTHSSQTSSSEVFLPIAIKPLDKDWPMSGANPNRSSWTPEEVRGKLTPIWYRPIEPMIPAKVQLIAALGNIYVSTARGLYAIDAETGAEKWVYPTILPLGNSPTVINGIAYVGGFDRKIHAINAHTGQGLWTYEGDAGFDTNPLVIDGILYAGNRDGYMYAIKTQGGEVGQLAWRFKTEGPINFSAAYQDGTIYFASNDSHAYALNAQTGALIWKSDKLLGAGFHSWWPVVYKDVVILSGSANYRSSNSLGDGRYIVHLDRDDVFPNYVDLPPGTLIGPRGDDNWIDASRVLQYYEDKPWRRTYFVLDRKTGEEQSYDFDNDGKREYPPMLWFGTHAGNRYPPIIGSDDILYQTISYATATSDIPRGHVSGWRIGTPYISTPSGGTKAVDEPLAYSAGGNVIYYNQCCDRSAGAFDISIQSGLSDDQEREWVYFDEGGMTLASIIPGYDLMQNSTDLDAVYGNTNGVYGLHGNQNPPIPYKNKVYMHRGNALIAFGNQQTDPIRLPLLSTRVGNEYEINIEIEHIRQLLTSEIEKILDAGHLRPGYILSGNFDHASIRDCGDHLTDYWHDPTESLYTLMLALPYLPEHIQLRVREFLQYEYSSYSPYQFVHIGWKEGAQREAFNLPPEIEAAMANYPASEYSNFGFVGWHFPPHIFYTLWKYAQIFGGAGDIFEASKNRFESAPSNDILQSMPFVHNSYIAGYLGYLELEKLAGYPESTSVRSELNRLLELRIENFEKDSPYGELICTPATLTAACYCKTLSVSRNFMYLTPELGQYLNDHAISKVNEAIIEYNWVAPYWFVSNFDQTYGEGAIQPIFVPNSIFQAKALILKESFIDLVRYLDVPGVERGDFYYIQNLVAVIQASNANP